ncbi:hypothetical protein VTO73DRAFT_4365 [Trametes versicolor]
MFAFTPTPVHTSPFARRAPAPALFSDLDLIDVVAERAAQEYAAAAARVQAIERQREQAQHQRYLQEASRRQAALDKYYRDQSRLIATSVQAYAAPRPTSTFTIEELALGVRREEERRRVLLARQREAQQARALAEARQRQEVEQRLRQAQQAKAQEAVLAILGLTNAQAAVPAQQSRVPAYCRQRVPIPSRAPQAPAPAEAHQQDLGVAEDDLYAALHGYLSQFAAPSEPSKPVDVKGKGKAVDVPTPVAAPSLAPQQTQHVPSFKEELEARMRTETDPEVQEALVKLYSDIFDVFHTREAQPVAGPSTSTRPSSSAPAPQTTPTAPEPAKPAHTEGADLHRTHALPPAVAEKLLAFYHARRARKLSLTQIAAVEDALRNLQSTFEFPTQLDFVNPLPSEEPGALAYTPNNTPVHSYEHALNGLLTQLDAVESNGDLAVRGRRKEVVREVERALEAVERRVEESRERERERSRERRRSAASSPAPSVAGSDAETVRPNAVNPEATVEITPAPAAIDEAPVADTISVTVADIPSSNNSVTPAPADITSASPAFALDTPVIAETDVVAQASSDIPSSAAVSEPIPVSADTANTPEADTVNIELVDVTSSAVSEPSSEVSIADSGVDVPVTEHSVPSTAPTPASVESPVVDTTGSADSAPIDDTPESPSPVAPSEPSDAPFTTAPSTFPPTAVPTPEAITRATSSTTDATFITADSDSAPSSPSDAVPEPMTRTPSAAEDTFLLSSTPLADAPKRKSHQTTVEDDEPELISKEDAEAKSDSEWSDVDAA